MAASIEIRNFLGDVETRALTRNQPISIGQHRTNDVCIEEDDVAPLQCRISWNKSGYEVVAASPQGVEVNGTIVQHASLLDGDVVRVGTVDIAFHSDEATAAAAPAAAAVPSSQEIKLSPISEDELTFPKYSGRRAPVPADDMQAKQKAEDKPKTDDKPKADDEAAEPEPESAKDKKRSRKSKSRRKDRKRRKDKQADGPLDDLFAELEADDVAGKPTIDRNIEYSGEPDRDRDRDQSTTAARLKSLRGRPSRPGEQEIVSSPLVIFLGAGGLVLLLAAATIFLVIGRETSQTRYDAAVAHMNEGKYSQAIDEFESFIDDYPRHRLTPLARLGLDKSLVERQIAGATPSWERGLTALQDLIDRQRNRPDFSELHDEIVAYAGRIAEGAAKAAEATKNREFLKISEDADRILVRYAPLDDPPRDLQDQIAAAVRSAELAIQRHETYETAIRDIKQSIEDSDPLQGLEIRRQLLNRYPDFRSDKQLAQLLEASLEAERGLVSREDDNVEPLTGEKEASTQPPLSLTLNQRSRTGEVSTGEVVFALAKDCCYGIDSVTGEPVWRRVVGLDAPFFPIRVATSVPGLLVFDSNRGELLLLDQKTGRTVWGQPLNDDAGAAEPAGAPLVHEGQIYLPTKDKQLYQIVAENGSVTTQLTFPQPLQAPPVLDTAGKRLFVAGERDVIYTLSMRPLACQGVSYLNHQAGSLEAPLLAMGDLLLMSENDRQGKSRLRVLDARDAGGRLKQLAQTRLEGLVDSQPIMYGNHLFMPFARERIAIYSVTDETGKEPLRLIARHDAASVYDGKTWLLAGAEGHFWMAGSALRHFILQTDTIAEDPRTLAVGLSTQPLQMLNRNLYAGRRLPYNKAVLFTQADREEMTSNWRTVLGSAPLAFGGEASGSLVVVSESGDVYRVSPGEVERGGFKRSSTARLDVDEATTDPLRSATLTDGRIAVASGQPQPRLWIVNTGGQFDANVPIDEPLEADPIQMGTGLVLPMSGKLRLMRSPGSSPVEDYLPPRDMNSAVGWAFLVPVDATQLLAIDTAGSLANIQFREAPVPHLAEVARVSLESPIDVSPQISGDRLLVADRRGSLQVLDVLTLETIHKTTLGGAATALYWPTPTQALVEIGRERLVCFAAENDLQQHWALDLQDAPLAGPPVLNDGMLVVALQNGDVIELDPSDGTQRRRLALGQPLVSGPIPLASLLVAPSIDGSLHRIEFGSATSD